MKNIGCALIIEDHPLYRDALVQLLTATLGADVRILVASNAEDGLGLARGRVDLGIVLVDPGLPGISGSQAVAALRDVFPATPIIAVSASEERRQASSVLRGGACALVSKAVSTEVLAGVVRRALAGEIASPEWITPTYNGVMPNDEESSPPLTQRQREILLLIVEGYANKEIGQRLSLAEPTVKMHVSAIFRALNVASRTQAVRAARQLAWLAQDESGMNVKFDRSQVE